VTLAVPQVQSIPSPATHNPIPPSSDSAAANGRGEATRSYHGARIHQVAVPPNESQAQNFYVHVPCLIGVWGGPMSKVQAHWLSKDIAGAFNTNSM